MNNLINDLFNIIDITLIDLNEDKYIYMINIQKIHQVLVMKITLKDVKKVFVQIMQILILMKLVLIIYLLMDIKLLTF